MKVIAQPKWVQRKCPFCYKELGKIESIRRKIRKICKCRHCGKLIDERMMIW